MNAWPLAALAATLALTAAAAPAEDLRVLQFSLDRPGAAAAQYTVTVRSSGQGTYVPHLTPPSALAAGAPADPADGQALRISPALVKKLFVTVPMVEGGRCETHNKGIAKTGVKVLSYHGAGRDAQCTYNYSDDDRVNDATAGFEGLAETMLYGQRLANKLRFDRLGLDGELESLEHALNDKQALEVGNITSVLEAIRADDRVMDRVRRRVEHLLALAAAAQTEAGADPIER